jgi:hypothetical protein
MLFYNVTYLYNISTVAQPCTVHPTPRVPSLRADRDCTNLSPPLTSDEEAVRAKHLLATILLSYYRTVRRSQGVSKYVWHSRIRRTILYQASEFIIL